MITTTIEWHKTTEKLPAKSGMYLAIYNICSFSGAPYAMTMTYSNKHKAFNVHDWEDEAETAIDVIYWAELPAFPEDESEDE